MAKEPPPEEHPNNEPRRPTEHEDKKADWINDLAQRSAGLTPPDQKAKGSGQKEPSPWSMSGAGLQFAITTAVFACIGFYLDRRFGWSPWGVIALTTLGFVGGFYLLIKEFLKDQGKK